MSTTVDIFEEVDAQALAAPTLSQTTKPILLALDIGSSGIRTAFFDDQGCEIDGASVRVGYGTSATDFATFDAEALLERVAQTID